MSVTALSRPNHSGSAQSRSSILDAAEALMAELGYERTTITSICQRSGLPVGSVYHHFGSKAGVLAAVLERGSARFFASMPSQEDLTGSPETTMREYWAAAADAIAANVSYFYLELDLTRFADDDPQITAVRDRVQQAIFNHLGAVIEPYARERGVADPSALTARLVAFTVTFTRGAIVEAGQDRLRLRDVMSDLYSILRAAILDAAR